MLYISNYISSDVFILNVVTGVVTMANSIPSTYKQVSFVKNSNADLQKLLKSVFLLGPSKAVLSKGNVIVSSSRVAQDSDDQSNDQNNSQANNQTNQSQGDNTSGNSESPSSSGESSSSESYNYSIFEALSFLRKCNKVYEDDNEDASDSENEPSEESSAEDEASDEDSSKDDSKDSNTDHEFADTDLEVVVNLPNEGCTKWHLRLNNVTDEAKVINALKSKKFKAAFDIANSQAANVVQGDQSAEGITVLSATTMIDKKKELLAPFIGKCRWAFDVGSEDNNDESFDLEIAIAPIDGKSKKPKTSTIYHAVFSIVGDITNGKLNWFDKFIKAKDFVTGNEDSNSDNDASETLHNWLQSNFKLVGDSAMYDDFLKVRKFVEDNLKKKTIEPNKDESSSITSYISTIKSEKSFISF